MDKKIRMADIASRLNVSIVTVSKALSGKEGVGDEMRGKILSLAKEMGYVPLRTKPGTVRRSSTDNIGIILAEHFFEENSFYANLYRQILKACSELGYTAMLELIKPESERSCANPAMIQGNKVDGIIFMGEINRDYLRNVSKCGLPYMLLDFYDDELNADSVTSDNTSGGYHLTKHLLQSGRSRIGFVGSICATSSIMDRFLGYTKVLLRAGIPLNPEWILEDRDSTGLLLPIELPKNMPDAFVCSYDTVAHNLILLLKQQGYRIPEDIAVVGYDDHQRSQFSNPPLTTYRVNTEDMGKIVVNQLVRRIQGKHYTRGNIVVKGTFIEREST